MLRLLVLVALLANAGYYLWSQGLLAGLGGLGFGPAVQREPQRVAAQIKPDMVRVLKSDEAKRLEQLATKPQECLLSGPLDIGRIPNLKLALPELLGGAAFAIEPWAEDARWIVYMGKYPSAEALAKKKLELRQLNLPYEGLRRADLEFGISLGAASTRQDAETLLAEVAKRGVRTARVLEELPSSQGERLRLPAVDDVVRAKLEEIKAASGAKAFVPCKAEAKSA